MLPIQEPFARQILEETGLSLGSWRQMVDLTGDSPHCASFRPSRDATALYVAAQGVTSWLNSEGWVLVQLDNSTSPVDDEVRSLQIFITGDEAWNSDTHRALLFEAGTAKQEVIALLIFLMLIFEWHVYIACEKSPDRRRLGVLDGDVLFYGPARACVDATTLIASLRDNPLALY